MKDIDFDELDRAVSSLMGSVPKSEPIKPDDGMKTLVITPSAPLGSAPEPTPANPVPATPGETAPARPSLATRRSGRFMDVVHPSSDMTKTVSSVSRSAGTIEPPAAVEMPTPSHPVPSELATPHPVEPSPVVGNEAVASARSDWPDPLDLHGTPEEEPEQAEAVSEDITMDLEEVSSVLSDEPADAQPLVSPFLPDAKVEKRPLGGLAVAETAVSDTSEGAAAPTELSPPEQLSATPTPDPGPTTEVQLPEELQSDLMAIEARQASTEAPAAVASTVKPVSAPSVTPQPAPAAASIPQQYKESPSTGEQTNGAIYDTATYHQPVQHPAKKPASWLWVVWVLGLLIIGAGGGALAYFYLLK